MNTNIASLILERHNDFLGDERAVASPTPSGGARTGTLAGPLTGPMVEVEGLSSPRICRFLNALVGAMDPEEIYLEIGTWKGRTLLSAAFGNVGRTCVGCDKFRTYGKYTGLGFLARRALERNIERYRKGSAVVEFHAATSERFFAETPPTRPVGVYFYDGDHSFGGTQHGMIAAAPFLSERSVVLVDDWNDPVIRRATIEGLRMAHLRTLWRRELPGDHAGRGFWNGLGVFYVEKKSDALRAFAA